MKTLSLRRFVSVFAASVLLAGASITSGCLIVAAGAVGAGAVAYVRGELNANLGSDYENTISATNKALQQLGIAKVNEKRDAFTCVIVARTAADKKIRIQLANAAQQLTKVNIRVGVVGDEPLSLSLLEKIKANL